MAKAKKSESADKADKPAAAPKKAASKSKKSDKKPAGGTTNLLGIDTGLAASAAAMAIANKALLHQPQAQQPAQGEKKESSAFKQLKQSMSKPTLPGGILGEVGGSASKKSNLPFGGGKQVGHNQTFGADVTRSGVPRRTPG